MKRIFAVATLLFGAALFAKETPSSLYDLTVNSLGGKPTALAAYKGKVTLVVNTASECGFTPQYAGLEKLYEEYAGKGFAILGFPSNDFGSQEPGSAEQIKTFCERNYGVKFPMFEKVATKGAAQSPVYKLLAAKDGGPKWNFHKYVVGKDGQVRKAFPSNVAPDAKELRAAIDAALAEK
jgi:glutathione peroxidase